MADPIRSGAGAASRRLFMQQAGIGSAAVAAASLGLSAAPAEAAQAFDASYDMVVCGSGCGGLASALFSRWQGNTAVILEKAGSIGGTTAKAAFWYWVPNNEAMKKAGIADPKPDFLKYVARLSNPQGFDPAHPRYGLTQWEYDMCGAIYDSASPAAELLAAKGALPYRHVPDVPDYFAELPEDKAPKGRVLVPAEAIPSMSDGGLVAVRTMSSKARQEGIPIRTGMRVKKILQNPAGRVIGVEAEDELGAVTRIRARKAVIFATGGFTHNVELRKNFLSGPIYGGCAAPSNEGDFVQMAGALGAQLRNMNYAWSCPVPLEKAVARDGSMSGMFSVAGDSMIFVNKYGRRTANEKLQYNELAQTFFEWDGARAEYPNLVRVAVWDQRSQDHSASAEYGRLIVPPGTDDRHVIKGATLAELARAIDERMAKYAGVTGGAKLSADFLPNLQAAIARFNGFAKTGKDLDFKRGERVVELLFNGDVKEEPGRSNPTMWPISDAGPYYAALVVPGTLDTKGGPKTDTHGRVLDARDQPIPGLYGVGNCVASASGRAYWAGGATLGPIIAFSYRAANAAHAETASAA
ncbi:Succinate dehydrogenase/fumarate reductase, flavoprotein subunit [Variovorax sp. HW608]|uniref:FAD-dependent oxidoreductase n=1 Tax=Variovorax sp. HW608 TaxID=1034889 RepID=UPI00081F82CF|nr:FAD-dependent oxidoreductase [Variovorax sp. HW608]SCK38968.1 Succinate dehydrogenase/fumarate reductase, flavoprotein subunit [Variovorax sp. HW608]